MARKKGTASASATITPAANIPGAPVWVESSQFSVTSSCDVIILTSDLGGPVSIDTPDGVYTGAALATALQTAMNASNTLTGTGTITFAVSYDSTTKKFTLGAGAGHTIALTVTGSDGAEMYGFTTAAAAAVSVTSDSETHGLGTITFDLDQNDNASVVQYAVYCNELSKYIGLDGVADEAAEVWGTPAQWNIGGANGRITVIGLTDYTSYTFMAKAKSESGVETTFGADSASMNTLAYVDWGSPDAAIQRMAASGNTRIMLEGVTAIDGTAASVAVDGTSKAIPVRFALENYDETVSSVTLEFSEDSGSTWATAHSYYEIDADNKTLRVTSDLGGPVDIAITEGTYDTPAAMATELATRLNANTTLTGSGTITFAVTHSGTTGKYTIDATANHTIALDWYNSSAAMVYGFTASHTAARTLTSDESRGSAPNTLTTSETGVEHTVYWDSARDAGKSEYKLSTVEVRVTPYDASPSGGDAAGVKTSVAFTVDNRPATVTVVNFDGRVFGKNLTPIFAAVMGDLTIGTHGYWEITIEDGNGAVALRTSSAEYTAGWMYETAPNTWAAVPAAGVSGAYINGVNRVRYTVQTALTADNDKYYLITMRQGERRDRG